MNPKLIKKQNNLNQRILNWEAEQMYPDTPVPLPEYEKPKPIKVNGGFINLLKSLRP